ncbi:extracellular solute-binding protein [Mesorhizobium sp. 8]|uniref:extracellular solute-binding protein n=1 Tax=Mesorhizobium sp. 8 TaxID=2584466 RepID=UPI00111D3CE3|nr:extracellular solute-binding protein [Mesorhizobium sp. 8]QDC01650.1 extracellular solute-binding protein [Mesorhizobium sp. 8]
MNLTIMAKVIAATAALGMMLSSARADDPLVVIASGGVWLESAKANFASCYKERTGEEPEILTLASTEVLNRLRANKDNPSIHVAMLSEIDAIRAGEEGLLDKLTVEKVPNLADVPEIYRKQWNDYATISNFGAMIVMYNKKNIPNPPADWKTLIDRTIAGDYGDRVSFPAVTMAWGPMFTWFLTSLYDGDENVVFEKYKAMLPHIAKYWTSPVDALNMFAAGELDILVYWDGRAYAFAQQNDWAGAYIPEPGAFQSAAMIGKVKNAPEKAWTYIDCVLSPKAQLGHAEMIKYPVVNSKVVYPDDLKKVLTPVEKVKQPDFRSFMDKIPAWVERWNKEIR